MKKLMSFILVAICVFGIAILSSDRVEANNPNYVHLANRWNDPWDETYRIQKWSKTAYELNIKKISGKIRVEAWGHSYKAGRTGNVSVSKGKKYVIKSKGQTKLTNYLVEWYGTGNNAYIVNSIHAYGSADGNWKPDR